MVEKPKYQLVMCSQSIEFLKVQPFAIFNLQLGIKDLIQDVQELMQPLLDILKMDQELELDYLQDQEKQFLEIVGQQVGSLLEEVEMKNQL